LEKKRSSNTKECAAETEVETDVAKKRHSARNRGFSFLVFIAAVLLAWFAMRPRHGGAAAFAGRVRCGGLGSSVLQVAGSDVDTEIGFSDGGAFCFCVDTARPPEDTALCFSGAFFLWRHGAAAYRYRLLAWALPYDPPPPYSAAAFCSKLRAPHRGKSLGPFVCGSRVLSLCSLGRYSCSAAWKGQQGRRRACRRHEDVISPGHASRHIGRRQLI
jgi:hypothetical protein